MSADVLARCAGAPISWGVCEVPDWGLQLDPARVLAEMAALGLTTTEHGPDGFLPLDDEEAAQTLAEHGLQLVSGFVPTILHDAAHDPEPGFVATLTRFDRLGASAVVLSADSGDDGYDERIELDEDAWALLLRRLDRLQQVAADAGFRVSLHPHVGTIVERADDVRRVLEGSTIPLCLDTGHLLIGGVDPVALAAEHAARIGHVHLKDVDAELAARVRDGELSYRDAVAVGLYVPLDEGAVDIGAIVAALEGAGYDGAYVLEQDVILTSPDEHPADDVRHSLDALTRITTDATLPSHASNEGSSHA